ncbi:AAA family ATPase [Chitinimonas sp.]|uniref:AAA family ATPase n=1 Tax=Chitinimonas sp. TaxID=1934313 RepID=UPI0035B4E6CD
MLNLKQLIIDLGAQQTELAELLGVSAAAVSQLLNHGIWPKTIDRGAWIGLVEDWLVERGASNAEIKTAFKRPVGVPRQGNEKTEQRVNAARSGDTSQPSEKESNDMVLRKQGLSQAAKKHWGIVQNPFEMDIGSVEQVYFNPDIRYAREAMLQTARNGGFLAVVAESGAGKSTLRRELEERLIAESDKTILIEPYVLGMEDNDQKGKSLRASHIAEAIMTSVAPLAKRMNSPEARFKQLHDALKESSVAGHKHCLVIEEAHSLSIPTLKHLKRFFELELGFRKLLSIILIGQPELKAKLSERDPQVREVVQRCELVELMPLTGNQLAEYIGFKLAVVGKKPEELLDQDAMEGIRAQLLIPSRNGQDAGTRAYPLAVNNLMTTLLNEAAQVGASKINAALIREV